MTEFEVSAGVAKPEYGITPSHKINITCSGPLEEWNTFTWWQKVLALVTGAPMIGAMIILAPFWILGAFWVWWSDRKDRKNPHLWAIDK